MSAAETRFMGIDFGEKRIGIALSDPLNIFSYPFKTILNDQNLLTEIKKIITEKNVTKIVLGKPSGSNTSTISLINKLEKFKSELEKKFSVNVIFWNEDFTSSIARERILESVTKKNKRKDKSLVDRNSAAIILHEFLNDQ